LNATQKPYLSIVVPVYNEEENVVPLYEKIRAVCESIGETYEVLFVDDGSQDNTFEELSELRNQEPHLVVIRFQQNAGQTAAMAAGFEFAQGERIISMDGDLQNDPTDIPNLLEKLDEDYDLVCGWRKERQDKFWTRRVPSVVANWIISKVTGVAIHDNGCSLKAYRSEVIKQVPLYGEMHRFIPAMSTVVGARIAEIVVKHHPRRFGTSKYGLGRIWRVILDILAFKLILSVFARHSNLNGQPLPQQSYDNQMKAKFNVFRVAAFLSLPFFIIGFLLINLAIIAALSFIGLGVSLMGISLITGWSLAKAQREAADLSPLASFFIYRCARRPIRCFGPSGAVLSALGGILTIGFPNVGPILINTGILVFCCGLFGETIAYANAKRVIDYTVEIFLNAKDSVKRFENVS
jgi:glycosyltransferase involved in cell wall biosynthesis